LIFGSQLPWEEILTMIYVSAVCLWRKKRGDHGSKSHIEFILLAVATNKPASQGEALEFRFF
jgi:hypothetical protein